MKHIITTSALIGCDGSETDTETMLTLENSNYNEVSKNDVMQFDKNNLANSDDKYSGLVMTSPFGRADINGEFIEFLFMRGFFPDTFLSIYGTFNIDLFNRIRRAYQKKNGQIMTGRTFVQRSTWNSLRGYFLIPDSSDPFGEYARVTSSYVNDLLSSTIHAQFYISEPHLMTENDIYMVYINTRPMLPYTTNNAFTLKELDYKLKIQRLVSTSKMKFTLYREISGTLQEATSLEIAYTGADQDWMHFVVTLGVAPLYSIDSTSMKYKRIETIFTWFKGTKSIAKSTSFTETDTIVSMYPVEGGSKRELIISVGLQAFSDSAMTNSIITNNFGLRMFEASVKQGAFPPDLIATSESLLDNRCIIHGFMDEYCMVHVFLTNENDSNPYGLNENRYSSRRSYCPVDQCRYCRSNHICMFAKTGTNEDLYYDKVLRFTRERYQETLYDPANPVNADEFVKITNNAGKDYWVRCPVHCKHNLPS